jgi:type II secretory pathway component PulM
MADLADVLFSDLRASRQTLNRLLSGSIIFALLGHFYVLEPYFQYKAQERKANAELQSARKEHAKLEKQLPKIRAANKQAKNALESIDSRIQEYPNHLRDTLPKIAQALRAREEIGLLEQIDPRFLVPPHMVPDLIQAVQQRRSRVSELDLPPHITEFEQGVRWYIENWFEALIKDIREQVNQPLLSLSQQQFRVELADLHTLADQGMEKLRHYLDGLDPNFWHVYSGLEASKMGVAQGLKQVLTEAFDPMLAEVAKLLRTVEQEIKRQEARSAQVEKNLKEIQKLWRKFEARIASLDSPFGKLPLGLTELITLFPLLIVILMVVTAGVLHKGSRLYIALWAEFKKKRKGANAVSLKQYVDSWYLPPYRNLVEPMALGVVFAVLAGIFVRAALLVAGESSLFTSLAGETEYFKRNLFTVAYLVGGLLMAGSAGFTHRTLWQTARAL